MYELIAAANRGVHVRLIVDHIASERDPMVGAYLASVHPNLKIKIYNPVATLGFRPKIDPSSIEMAGGLLTHFNRTNQRMHNKIFIVDEMIGITGGRNCENSYFDQSQGLNYKDRDALVAGPAVLEMAKTFERYWGFKLAVDIADMVDVTAIRKQGAFQHWNSKADFALHGFFDAMDTMANDPSVIQQTFADLMHRVATAQIIVDEPGKNNKAWFGRFRGAGNITTELASLIANAKRSIVIQTPYLVLSASAVNLFADLRKKQPAIDIRISTNSLAATDSWHTYAISFQQKQTYLRELGFKIYEFKPYPGDLRWFMPSWDSLRTRQVQPPLIPLEHPDPATESRLSIDARWEQAANEAAMLNTQPLAEPYLCLHAKSMVIDDEIVFIGSYNLDPRSENLNTEVGLVIKDHGIARILKQTILQDTQPQNAWIIARNDYPMIIEETNAVLEIFSRWIPIVDPWPIRYAGSYELKANARSVDPSDPEFYDRYRFVGSFPQVGLDRLDKIMGTWMLKTIGGFTKPLL
jgi:putative cardiolipin synthase